MLDILIVRMYVHYKLRDLLFLFGPASVSVREKTVEQVLRAMLKAPRRLPAFISALLTEQFLDRKYHVYDSI